MPAHSIAHLVHLRQGLGSVAVAGHADVGVVVFRRKTASSPHILKCNLLVAVICVRGEISVVR